MKVATLLGGLALISACAHDYDDVFAGARDCSPGTFVQERSVQANSQRFACFIRAARPGEHQSDAPGPLASGAAPAGAPAQAGPEAASSAPAEVPADDRPTRQENQLTLNALYGRETALLAQAGKGGDSPYIGIALSGGGVRSASFAVGVLRALYDLNLLPRAGYLSTVSGGGYAGGWMMSYHDVGEKQLPGCGLALTLDRPPTRGFAARPRLDELFRPGSRYRYHLAQHGEYLGYGHGHDSEAQLAWTMLKSTVTMPLNLALNLVLGYDLDIGPYRRFYRDGIQAAFLFDYTDAGQSRTLPLKPYPMSCFGPSAERPFWIINMTLSLIDDDGAHHGRVGDAFELTPLWGGSTSVGYVKTPTTLVEDRYRDVELDTTDKARDTGYLAWSPTLPRPARWGADVYAPTADNYWMSPSFGVPISGAALDSHNVTQGLLFDAVLNLFDADLGYFVNGWSASWYPHPAGRPHSAAQSLVERLGFYVPLPFVNQMVESHRRTAGAKRYLLMDGGIFDNVGIYALIRRGVRFIVVSDATSDGADAICKRSYDGKWHLDQAALGSAFTDLRATEVLLRSDFGATVSWHWEDLCTPLSTSPVLDRPHGFVMTGSIGHLPIDGDRNHDAVRIVYVKAAYPQDGQVLRSGSFVDVTKTNDPQFANDTTVNQFFSEDRVLSYEQLGYEQLAPGSPGAACLDRAYRAFCRDRHPDGKVDAGDSCPPLYSQDVALPEGEVKAFVERCGEVGSPSATPLGLPIGPGASGGAKTTPAAHPSGPATATPAAPAPPGHEPKATPPFATPQRTNEPAIP
jgi:hypothetical protein